MIEWHSPWVWSLFIPLALIVAFSFKKHKKSGFKFSDVSIFKNMAFSFAVFFSRLPKYFFILSAGLAILALSRPRQADTQVQKNVEGIDIVIALDISDSMLIEDMKPENRLEASKKTIKEFIEKRISDRIGLVVFSGESYTRVPMTLDYPLLLNNLSKVETSSGIKMGTAIGVALANAVARLKDSTAKSRVVIFLTDGENNTGTIDPMTAIDIAKGYDVKVYSIGMGRDGQARLPVYIETPTGQKIKQYRPIHSKINEGLLSKMASETGGKFYRANTSNALDEVFSEINQLETTKIEVNQFTTYEELFQKFLIFALGLYLLGFFIKYIAARRMP